MKVYVELIGFASALSGGVKKTEVELPSDKAVCGDVFKILGSRYGDTFSSMVYNEQAQEINLLTMMNGQSCGYNTPIEDGASLQVTMHMDGG